MTAAPAHPAGAAVVRPGADGGILPTAAFGVPGVVLNHVMPGEAFEPVVDFASTGVLGTWAMIMICSLLFRRRAGDGRVTRPGYRLRRAPWTQIVAPGSPASVAVLMWLDGGVGRTVACLPQGPGRYVRLIA